jgi:hypothetical protein
MNSPEGAALLHELLCRLEDARGACLRLRAFLEEDGPVAPHTPPPPPPTVVHLDPQTHRVITEWLDADREWSGAHAPLPPKADAVAALESIEEGIRELCIRVLRLEGPA